MQKKELVSGAKPIICVKEKAKQEVGGLQKGENDIPMRAHGRYCARVNSAQLEKQCSACHTACNPTGESFYE